jgi:hypothetical protein
MRKLWFICVLSTYALCRLRVSGGDFEVEGTVLQAFGNSTNRFDFRVACWGERYQIQTRDYFDSPTERVVGFDGADFFHLDRLSDPSGKPIEFGHVHSGRVATNLFGVGDLLRLAFLDRSRDPNGASLTNIAHFSGNDIIFGRHRGVVITNGPTSASGYSGVKFLGSRPEGPTDEFIGDFQVTGWTNYRGMTLPLRFALRSVVPESLNNEKPPRVVEFMEGTVVRVGNPAVSEVLPRISTTSVQVRDVRFVAETGAPILYLITNQVWVARKEPWLMAKVRDMQLRRAASEGQLRSKRIPLYFAFFVLLVSPLFFFVFRSRTRNLTPTPQ